MFMMMHNIKAQAGWPPVRVLPALIISTTHKTPPSDYSYFLILSYHEVPSFEMPADIFTSVEAISQVFGNFIPTVLI